MLDKQIEKILGRFYYLTDEYVNDRFENDYKYYIVDARTNNAFKGFDSLEEIKEYLEYMKEVKRI